MGLMQYSQSGLKLTEQFEGVRLQAYQDQVGVWTIGFGHTRNVTSGMTCTPIQAEQWLLEDVQQCVDSLNAHLHISVTQNEFDALVDFAFNLGIGALLESTLLKYVNAGKFELAANEFQRWDRAGGKEVAGLLRRRLAEKQEFQS